MLPEDTITAKVAARLVGVHVSAVYRWVMSGRLRAWRVGGRLRLSRADVLAVIQAVQARRR